MKYLYVVTHPKCRRDGLENVKRMEKPTILSIHFPNKTNQPIHKVRFAMLISVGHAFCI